MSIIPLNKVTVFGIPEDKQAVLDGLQRLGCLHLISLQPPAKTAEFAVSEPAEDARKALRYIMDVPRRRHQITDESVFALDCVVAEALANQQRQREAEDRKLSLAQRLDELAPWGDFTLPNLDELGGYRLWFYRVPSAKVPSFREALHKLELPWQIVYESQRNTYFAIIAEKEPATDVLTVKRTHAGSISPQDLKHQLQQVEIEIDQIEAEHESLSRWIFLLSKNLARVEDRDALNHAQKQAAEQDGIFLVQGWLPQRDLKRLDAFSQQQGLAFLAEPPNPSEKPPTLMENPLTLTGGQDLVTFYETPGYRDWDPSIVVFFSFATFFAMILCDAGYAVVLAGVVAYFWQPMGKSPGGRHFRILAIVGLIFALGYGILAGSYFGVEPPAGSLLGRLNIINLNDYNEMMKFSITVGCLHIILANGVVAYRSVGISSKAKPLGWIAIILGGLSMYLSGGVVGLFHLGVGLGVGGLLAILLLSSDRPVNSLKSILLRLLDGISSLVGISKLFGDIMSYLRLFALGLASASLAITFNQLAEQAHQAVPGLGVLIAILILLLGHGINILLGIISGFVHGLRLNFIEFFNWSLSEEGTPFQAFAKKETDS
jgi:V/A-type H+-transporting ATPase subunit I